MLSSNGGIESVVVSVAVETACTVVSSCVGAMNSIGPEVSICSSGSFEVEAPRSVRRVVMLVLGNLVTKRLTKKLIFFVKKIVLPGMFFL
jgi:hypothetical protein